MSIDIQVLADLAFILHILHILAILLQTKKSAQGEDETPRAHNIARRGLKPRLRRLFRLLDLTQRLQRTMRRRHRPPQPTRHQRLSLTTK